VIDERNTAVMQRSRVLAPASIYTPTAEMIFSVFSKKAKHENNGCTETGKV